MVDAAIEAHGGEARWKQVSALGLTWTFRGMMFKLRLRERSLRRLHATISTRDPKVEVTPFPHGGSSGRFLGADVELSTGARLPNARTSFDSVRSLFWWNDFEMLYFAGYVLWNYAQLPFLLLQPGIELRDAGETTFKGERWKKVSATFPSHFPTHSPTQTFFFGPDGRLRRHDYFVGIMSPLAKGARFIHAYHEVGGLLLPARIEMRLGTWGERFLPLLSLGFVDFDDLTLQG